MTSPKRLCGRAVFCVQTRAASKRRSPSLVHGAMLNLVLSAGIWLASFAGFFYCEGRAYRDAYLIAYGVYPALLPWDRNEVVYFGFNVGFGDVFALLLFPTLIATYVLIIFVAGRTYFEKRRESSVVADAPWRPVSFWNLHELLPMQAWSIAIVGVLLCSVVFMIGVAFMLQHSQDQGAEKARTELAAENNCNLMALESDGYISVHVERLAESRLEVYDGFLVTCASGNCAIRDVTRNSSRFIPKEGILRFDTVPKGSV